MPEISLLTKTLFKAGDGCAKRQWLDAYRPELRTPFSESEQATFREGKEIELFARRIYPDGTVTPYVGLTDEQAAEKTADLIGAGTQTLFEATIIADGRLVRCDVLRTDGEGGWIVDEIKSGTFKDEKDLGKKGYLQDLAFQVDVLRRAGFRITGAGLVLMRRSYVYDGGAYDPTELFFRFEALELADELSNETEARAQNGLTTLSLSEAPNVETNTHCKNCGYYDLCHVDAPAFDVVKLPRITRKKVDEMRAAGIRTIHDVPASYKLTDSQHRLRRAVVEDRAIIEAELLQAVNGITFPAAFVDFESFQPGLPVYPNTTPYTQICFQWSVHILRSANGEAEHFEFLHHDGSDPRAEFCRTLWETIQDTCCFVHYSDFEIQRLREMAEAGIPHAHELLEFSRRCRHDLHDTIKDYVCHPKFGGRTSIKVVLPALVPHLTYKGMPIGDGATAMTRYKQMIDPGLDPARAAEIRRDLLDYCRVDTLAMVEIYWALLRLVGR